MDDRTFTSLIDFLSKVPAITGTIGKGAEEDGRWWVKFEIDINNQFAWHAVQELGHVLNYLSIEERLPTTFHPVSPPPYMNGGPEEYLSWVIECHDSKFRPGTCAKWLEERLPKPVDDLSQWENE
ncbi:hypothetical protein [Methylotuvimicrobium sp. KM1]|uniref:hypothetical protein n=1 Tax=Methylotuvimicrobium sp. KM1 TaxID=3377707 RepID=UPI0038505834